MINEWLAATLIVAAYLLGRYQDPITTRLARLIDRAAGYRD